VLKHPKAKGTRLEKEVVQRFIDAGFISERMWGSDGKSRGLPHEVDVTVLDDNVEPTSEDEPTHSPIWIQCKSVAKICAKYKPSDKVDATVFKENRGEPYIMFKLDDFIKRFM
jgi:hypothetical protein